MENPLWSKFEINCTEYLNKNYGHYAEFILKGGSNSNTPDIRVETNSGNTFYIEAKHCPAQSGQFVLLPDNSTLSFKYSTKNYTPINEHSIKIIKYMNKNFDLFNSAGTAGEEIILDDGSSTFVAWIIGVYKSKKVKYFITNDYIILPIDKFGEYFNVTANYRIKRSGSSSVGKSHIKEVLERIKELDFVITGARPCNDKLFVSSIEYYDDEQFIYKGYNYKFSRRGHEYEIRKLSNTCNANVIFSIELKKFSGITSQEFISDIK